MRVVFKVEEAIPGLADAGDFIGLFLNGRHRPVVRYTEHSADALERLVTYRDRMTPYDPPTASLNQLTRALSGAQVLPDPSNPTDLRVVEASD